MKKRRVGRVYLDNPSHSSDTIFLGDDLPSASRKNSSKIVDDPALHALLEKYDKLINRQHHEGVIREEYNYTVSDFNLTYDDLEEQLNDIYKNENHAFKLDFYLGIVLRNAEGELRYFYASENDSVLNEPYQISQKKDLDNLLLVLRNKDLLQVAMQSLPNSKWSVYVITIIRWVVVRI